MTVPTIFAFLQFLAARLHENLLQFMQYNTVLGLQSLMLIFDFDSRSLNLSRTDISGSSNGVPFRNRSFGDAAIGTPAVI